MRRADFHEVCLSLFHLDRFFRANGELYSSLDTNEEMKLNIRVSMDTAGGTRLNFYPRGPHFFPIDQPDCNDAGIRRDSFFQQSARLRSNTTGPSTSNW